MKEVISPYAKEDPDAQVFGGKVVLSPIQKRMFKETGKFYVTDEQQEIIDKYIGPNATLPRFKSPFPPGWDAFLRPDLIWEYVYDEISPCKKVTPITEEEFQENWEKVVKRFKDCVDRYEEEKKQLGIESSDEEAKI